MSASATAARPGYAEASRALLRDTVLDALGRLLADRVWADVPLSAVAEQAGVSRQTLYNVFGSRHELAQAYVLREAERFVVAIEQEIRAHSDDPRVALARALEIFLAAAETHPLVRAIAAADDGDELLALVTTRGAPVLERVAERLADTISGTWPAVSGASAQLVADCVVRLAISHAALPATPPRQTANRIGEVLGPYMDEVLASAKI